MDCPKMDFDNVYFWRQHIILGSQVLLSLSFGMTEVIYFTIGNTAWGVVDILVTIATLLGYIIQALVMTSFGRKPAFFFINVALCANACILFTIEPEEPIGIKICFAKVFYGYTCGGLFSEVMILSEFCEPKLRCCFNAMNYAATYLGAFVMFLVSTGAPSKWRAVVACVPSCLALLSILKWPESPSYLVNKGNLSQAEETFFWLRQKTELAQQEFDSMVASRRQTLNDSLQHRSLVKRFLRKVRKKVFWKLFATVSSVLVLMRIFINAGTKLSYDNVLKNEYFISSENSHLAWKIINCVSAIFYFFMILISILPLSLKKRRYFLFTVVIFVTVVTALISLSEFYFGTDIASPAYVVSILVLIQKLSTHFCVKPVCLTILGEMISTVRTAGVLCALGTMSTLILVANSLLNALLFDSFAVLNLVVSNISIICLVLLYYFLPETKDKTLIEIECELRNVTLNRRQLLLGPGGIPQVLPLNVAKQRNTYPLEVTRPLGFYDDQDYNRPEPIG